MKEPVRILSDLHLGHKVSRIERVAALRPLIAGAGTVVFNGDTWQELALPFRERSAAMLEELKTALRGGGRRRRFFCRATTIPAGPAPAGSSWRAAGSSSLTATPCCLLDLRGNGRSSWPANGWRSFGGNIRTAETDAEERLRLAREIARELCSVEYPFGRSFIQRAWDAVVPPRRAFKMLEAWFTQGRRWRTVLRTLFSARRRCW